MSFFIVQEWRLVLVQEGINFGYPKIEDNRLAQETVSGSLRWAGLWGSPGAM